MMEPPNDDDDAAENAELVAAIRRDTEIAVARRCLEICEELVETSEGQRHRTWEEIAHVVMRELLHWGGGGS
jgi:hypothetical protein